MIPTAEIDHIRAALTAAPMLTNPSPHVYVESLFSDAFYQRMLDEFPSGDGVLARWNHGGDPNVFFGNYDRRWEINFPEGLELLSDGSRTFWTSLSAFICGPEFAAMLVSKFQAPLRERFGADLEDPLFFDRKVRGAMMLNKHDPNYYLGPHTDRFEKIVTCVFYMPERPGLDHLGTSLYAPKEEGFTCRGMVHHDPSLFVKRETMPFRANSAFIFARSDVLFHGVERFTDAELQGSARPGFQMQFWEK